VHFAAHSTPCPYASQVEAGGGSEGLLQGLECHSLMLSFFDEMWDSVGDGAGVVSRQQAAMRQVGYS